MSIVTPAAGRRAREGIIGVDPGGGGRGTDPQKFGAEGILDVPPKFVMCICEYGIVMLFYLLFFVQV